RPLPAHVFLLVMALMAVTWAALVVGRVRAELVSGYDRLCLPTWHLARLLPEHPGSAVESSCGPGPLSEAVCSLGPTGRRLGAGARRVLSEERLHVGAGQGAVLRRVALDRGEQGGSGGRHGVHDVRLEALLEGLAHRAGICEPVVRVLLERAVDELCEAVRD